VCFKKCLKKLVFHQSTVNASAPSSVYSILLQSIHPRLLSCICVFIFFLFTAMHVKSLAFCVWEWRRYTQYISISPFKSTDENLFWWNKHRIWCKWLDITTFVCLWCCTTIVVIGRKVRFHHALSLWWNKGYSSAGQPLE